MKNIEKLGYLQEHHFNEWLVKRSHVLNKMSERQSLLCVCKRLATGFHENGCTKFQNAVTNETVRQLSALIPSKQTL